MKHKKIELREKNDSE